MTDAMEVEAIVSALLREHGEQFIGLSIPDSDIEPFARQIAETALEAVRALRPAGEPGIKARVKPEIITALREWAEFEQDGGNVEQGAAIDAILDWYDAAIIAPASPIIDSKVAGPVVKALEWRNVDSPDMASDAWWYEAYSPFGNYTITFVERHTLPWLLEPFFSGLDSNYATEDQAKAAAQQDYEQRILSALATPTAANATEGDGWISESMRLAAQQVLVLHPLLPPLAASLLDKVASMPTCPAPTSPDTKEQGR